MSLGSKYMRIGLGDKEVKNYMSPNVYQLVDGEGDTFDTARGATILAQLKKQTSEDFFAILPVSDIVKAESSDSTV